MLVKKPNRERFYLRWVKGFIVFEGIAFVGCYFVWSKLNSDRDFRYYMHKNWPIILNQFYHFTKANNPYCKVDVQDKQIWSKLENSD